MLYFIVVWSFLAVICFLIGLSLVNLLRADCFNRKGDRFIGAVWIGIIILATSLLATSFLLPLSPLIGAVVAGCLVSPSLLSLHWRTEIRAWQLTLSKKSIFIFLLIELITAALVAKQVTWIDTGLYHYGIIQWLSEFGTVPGMALLLRHLGFTSSWLALAAPLNAEFFDTRVSAVTNGFAFLISALQFLICLTYIVKNKAQLSDWLIIVSSLIILPFIATSSLMSAILVSPSPDLPIVFLIQVVAWSILVVSEQETLFVRSPRLKARTIPLILAAGAVTIKLTALPLLLIASIFYVFAKEISVGHILRGSIFTTLVLSPLLISGIITSGCPLYPSSFLCLDLPWSVSAQAVEQVAEHTHGYGVTAKLSSTTDSISSAFPKMWQWLSSADKLDIATALLIAISTFYAIYIGKNSLSSRNNCPGQLWLLALSASGILFLLMTALQFRFGMGYFVLLPAFSIANFCAVRFRRVFTFNNIKFISSYKSAISRFCVIYFLFLTTIAVIAIAQNRTLFALFLPPQLPQANLEEKQINDITYFSPEGSKLCWAAELPCAFEVTKDVKLRDPKQGIKAGFIRTR